MTDLLQIERVGKRFRGLRALDDVSFRVEEGGVFGIIGGNGAGKTSCSISFPERSSRMSALCALPVLTSPAKRPAASA